MNIPNVRPACARSLLVVIWCLWLAIPSQAAPSQAGADLTLGFWNIRDLSAANRDKGELQKIAQVAHSMDCLAICELNDGSVLSKLLKELRAQGGKWKRVQTSAKVGNTQSTAERYGFVYRSDKLKIRGKPKVLPPAFYAPAGETAVREFDREPFVCVFSTLDGRFDFTMIVVHITWGSKASYRIGEICALGNYFQQVQEGDPTDNDVLLCGDFNRNVGDPPSLGVLQSSVPHLIDTTSPDIPTKIDTTNTYDHLLLQTNFVTEYTGVHGVIRFDEELFDNDDEVAAKVCSDHRPVWIRVRVPEQDDD